MSDVRRAPRTARPGRDERRRQRRHRRKRARRRQVTVPMIRSNVRVGVRGRGRGLQQGLPRGLRRGRGRPTGPRAQRRARERERARRASGRDGERRVSRRGSPRAPRVPQRGSAPVPRAAAAERGDIRHAARAGTRLGHRRRMEQLEQRRRERVVERAPRALGRRGRRRRRRRDARVRVRARRSSRRVRTPGRPRPRARGPEVRGDAGGFSRRRRRHRRRRGSDPAKRATSRPAADAGTTPRIAAHLRGTVRTRTTIAVSGPAFVVVELGVEGRVRAYVPGDVARAPGGELRDAARADSLAKHVRGSQRAVQRALSSSALHPSHRRRRVRPHATETERAADPRQRHGVGLRQDAVHVQPRLARGGGGRGRGAAAAAAAAAARAGSVLDGDARPPFESERRGERRGGSRAVVAGGFEDEVPPVEVRLDALSSAVFGGEEAE